MMMVTVIAAIVVVAVVQIICSGNIATGETGLES
jgi:hypothetical protein